MAATLADKECCQEKQQLLSRNVPFGVENWVSKTWRRFGLDSTLRARGRPRTFLTYL